MQSHFYEHPVAVEVVLIKYLLLIFVHTSSEFETILSGICQVKMVQTGSLFFFFGGRNALEKVRCTIDLSFQIHFFSLFLASS